MKRFGIVAALALLVLAGLALLVWRERTVRAQAPAAGSTAAPHNHHVPPQERGSGIYQYDHPGQRAFAAGQVYDPELPPITPTPNGVREFTLVVEENVLHEVAPGVKIPAWTFNRTVPGPVLHAIEGETLRITLVNKGELPHTIHFHGIHPSAMDGVFEMVPPGGSFTYEFVAQPFGIMPYHCHSMPTSQHIQNGLYGMMIIEPKQGRKKMRDLAMVMSAFDLDRDGEAEFYSWNGRAFQYADQPIQLTKGEPVRMYVMNMFEESMVPHLHGNLFQLYPTGTSLQPSEYTDVKTLNIAERAILEFQYDFPGYFMFQCHVSEHMEQGLMGWFHVNENAQSRSGN
jgi:FtsP/CotA-like multicopper oxidase with cupredoxin domain